MKTCETCRFYDVKDANHICSCPKMIYGYGNEKVDPDGVAIENDEGWGMWPEPGFGCIHHTEAELANSSVENREAEI